MTRRAISLLILIFAVVAAIFVIPPLLRTANPAPLTLSAQPDLIARPEIALAPNPSQAETIQLLAVTEKQKAPAPGLEARPVDPATLADLPGYDPIVFGHHYTYAVSPDRKVLAIIIWPSDSGAAGKLHLIDLDTWSDGFTDVRIDNHVNDLTFTADARTLYWTMPTGMPRDYQLYRYDLDSRQLSASTQLPSSFVPWIQRLTSGDVAMFGVPTDSDWLTEDIPRVLIVNTARDRIMSDIRLDGVKAGQVREQALDATASAQEESWQYASYSPGLAWDVERKLLYIAHADQDKVTIVDLANGRVLKQTQIRPRQPLLQWISDSLAPPAGAKGGPWSGARVLLSGDGRRLYALNEKTEMGISGPADLRVIATTGMREIAHLNELLTDFALTPDGKSLLVIKAGVDRSYGFDSTVSRDVYILDAESLQERMHMRIDQVDQLSFEGFSSDGRYAYLRGSSAEWVEGSGWRNWRLLWQVLDLHSYHLISPGESESLYGALLHIAP